MVPETNNITGIEDAPEQAKKPYVAPQLIVYGNIEQITKGGAAEEGDVEAGSTGGL
jgi:hypothetical protein